MVILSVSNQLLSLNCFLLGFIVIYLLIAGQKFGRRVSRIEQATLDAAAAAKRVAEALTVEQEKVDAARDVLHEAAEQATQTMEDGSK